MSSNMDGCGRGCVLDVAQCPKKEVTRYAHVINKFIKEQPVINLNPQTVNAALQFDTDAVEHKTCHTLVLMIWALVHRQTLDVEPLMNCMGSHLTMVSFVDFTPM